MIKKHLTTCSIILVLFVATKVFIYGTPVNLFKSIKFGEIPAKAESSADTYYNSLNFANESLPLGDDQVKWRMNKMLKAHNYENLQTSQLHRKAAQWFPLIEPILKAYGIPEDFKYVPLVESGLKSGTSPKGASGYWQFMPQTARGLGLRVNGNVDERQQLQKSTVAACKYLKSLFRELNNWTLVAAAYNIGEGGLKRQISRQNQDNYFKMKLNRETASYVYKLISMKEIIENPALYGYTTKHRKLLADIDIRPRVKYPEFNPIIEHNATIMGLQLL